MTIEEMKQKKIEFGYSYEQIARLSGLPLGTVQKVLGGITKAPRYETLKALEAVFAPAKNEDMICEPTFVYQLNAEKEPGEYTVDDYFAWPEEERIELIDGVIYNMSSPTDVHQIIASELFVKIHTFIRQNRGDCIPVISPIDVQINEDDKTIIQPDIVVVCDRRKFQKGRIIGAPDFIAEILSPATRKKDMTKKLEKYLDAGVREYWIVDPVKKRVLVYTEPELNDVDLSIYTFSDTIPVSIYNGACRIDFKEIDEYVKFLY